MGRMNVVPADRRLGIADCQQHCPYQGELALLADVLIAAAAEVVAMKCSGAAEVPSEALVENGEGLAATGLLKSGMELVCGG